MTHTNPCETCARLERCLAVLDGMIPDRIPVVPQTFMLAAETAGIKAGELAHSVGIMAHTQVVS